MSSLQNRVSEILQGFEVSHDRIRAISDEFIRLTNQGLKSNKEAMAMIPSYVTAVPTGKESGTFLAVDLGGTNFRVCSVHLNGNGTFKLIQSKSVIPKSLMVGSSKELFSFLARHVDAFIKTHLDEKFTEDTESSTSQHILKLGFTFSFPVNQTAINKGTLLRWTKGFNIKDAVGKDVCKLLQDELDALKLPVHVSALVNDTVGTLMSRAYSAPGLGNTMLGVILGTGTNCAYVENISSISKISLQSDKNIMVVNTEWGSFDNALTVLPFTSIDSEVDGNSPNPGYHMFEKLVSGMFLGEILRITLCNLHKEGVLFSSSSESLELPWSIDTSTLSKIEADNTEDLSKTKETISMDLNIVATLEECKAIKKIVNAIGKRSAYLAGAAICGILTHTRALEKMETVDIGLDGSVFEFYPGYENLMRESIKYLLGEDEKRVMLDIAKDGSGVGAALCALVA
ncbi:hexokinase-domain-containing protein [Dipodascopsis uninucleata]